MHITYTTMIYRSIAVIATFELLPRLQKWPSSQTSPNEVSPPVAPLRCWNWQPDDAGKPS